MDDFSKALKHDLLVEQFRGKPKIQALAEVLGEEFQEIADFFEQLRTERNMDRAVGKQLDGVGDIVVLSREEASEYANLARTGDASDDEVYRKYLFYKVLKNTNNCTYPELIKAFRMFWDKPLYYSEDPEYPATMFLKTGILRPEDHAEDLLSAPIIKAAGVGIHITAITESPEVSPDLRITPFLGRGMAITELPELEPVLPVVGLYIAPISGRGMTITKLPEIEPERGVAVAMGCVSVAAHGSIMETRLPTLPEFDTEIPAAVDGRFFAAVHGSITETRLPELKEENE